jgi:FkbM family methyltransferase
MLQKTSQAGFASFQTGGTNMVILALLWYLHSFVYLTSALAFAFPIEVHRFGADQKTVHLVITTERNPIKQVRKFCTEHSIPSDTCHVIGNHTLQHFALIGVDVIAHIQCSIDDTILAIDGELTLQAALVWGGTGLKVNLNGVSNIQQSALIVLGFGKGSAVDSTVQRHCEDFHLNGKQCYELLLEVENYYTCLHYREGGASLQNLLRGTHFNDDLERMYVLYDVQDARYVFASVQQLRALQADQFCREKQLMRPQCAELSRKVQQAGLAFDPTYGDEMYATVYIYEALQAIVQQQTGGGAPSASDSSRRHDALVDMDFIEIGTSNFNTISQMLDVNDPASLRGLAVEPSAEYLAQLPVRAGITKVNAAIVTEIQVLNADTTGDLLFELYYIPEKVVKELELPFYLTGCNSIGDYHRLHVGGGFTQYVQIAKVPALTIRQLLTEYRVRRIRLLKIDAEGYDITILRELYMYLVARKDPTLCPERIFFESNLYEQAGAIGELVAKYVSLGYTVVFKGEDTILERVQT